MSATATPTLRWRVDSYQHTPAAATPTPFTEPRSEPTSVPYTSTPLPAARRKRSRQDDTENTPLRPIVRQRRQPDAMELVDGSGLLFPNTPLKKAPREYLRPGDKLDKLFTCLKTLDWTIGDLLYYLFRHKDDTGNDITRSGTHSKSVSHFLQGTTKRTVGEILGMWYEGQDGRVLPESKLQVPMFALSPEYKSMKQPARAVLSAFAAQTAASKLDREARNAVRPSSGLHVTSRVRGKNQAKWADIGDNTVSRVQEVIKLHQPLTFQLLMTVGGALKDGVIIAGPREALRRPLDMVCTHVISQLNFARNNEARLLPLARGITHFAHSAPVDLIAYSSRIGEMPAYQTIRRSLSGLADHETLVVKEHALDPTKVGFIQFDNVQNYLRQREHRIGRANQMNIGIAATYCELEGVDPAALDLEEKRRLVSHSKRSQLTTRQLISMIDFDHLATVFTLHWLQNIVDMVPQLHGLKANVQAMFIDKASKLPLPAHPTKVHPLATSGKNETVTSDLKDALLDFQQQLGYTESAYSKRLLIAGGDGLTFQKTLGIQQYLQSHPDDFQSFSTLLPVLSLWHTGWTDVMRIYGIHYKTRVSADPSSLGHSAAQINRPDPQNIKKVDYDQGVGLLDLALDVRMLDCWRLHLGCTGTIFEHFEHLEASSSLPTVDDLLVMASKLSKAYSSTHGISLALSDATNVGTLGTEWGSTVPLGSPWTPSPSVPLSATSESQLDDLTTSTGKKGRKKKLTPSALEEDGDRVLANEITFLRDALISREFRVAVALGDVGRVYEAIKYMLFPFSGSRHTNYSRYLLETICQLELESSHALRDAVLRSCVVNLTGRPGAFSAADLMQEYFNHLLEAIVDKKGVEYGAPFIRNIVSRNLHHFARIKLDMRIGVGLKKHSGRHKERHLDPEVITLLKVYQDLELHSRRPGRVYDTAEENIDHFDLGIRNLDNGRLKRWTETTCLARTIRTGQQVSLSRKPQDDDDADAGCSDEDNTSDDEEADVILSGHRLAFGHLVDDQLVHSIVDDEVIDSFYDDEVGMEEYGPEDDKIHYVNSDV